MIMNLNISFLKFTVYAELYIGAFIIFENPTYINCVIPKWKNEPSLRFTGD